MIINAFASSDMVSAKSAGSLNPPDQVLAKITASTAPRVGAAEAAATSESFNWIVDFAKYDRKIDDLKAFMAKAPMHLPCIMQPPFTEVLKECISSAHGPFTTTGGLLGHMWDIIAKNIMPEHITLGMEIAKSAVDGHDMPDCLHDIFNGNAETVANLCQVRGRYMIAAFGALFTGGAQVYEVTDFDMVVVTGRVMSSPAMRDCLCEMDANANDKVEWVDAWASAANAIRSAASCDDALETLRLRRRQANEGSTGPDRPDGAGKGGTGSDGPQVEGKDGKDSDGPQE
eukprot:6090272-Pyramimonas_sp.AAC.1